tara:strand:+ start:1807 stop:2901 length:1095 start_codon:yes stop_codon:yes gene_type:complete
MKIPFIEFEYEYETNKKELSNLLENHIVNGDFIGGKNVEIFEQNLCKFLNVKYCVSVGNGTDALMVALAALDLEKKEVIVPSFSFFATSEAVVQVGLEPIFVDINRKDCNIDVNKIEEKINENTGAILPVHLFGNPAEMKKIKELAEKYDLKIVEDVAQSFGTNYCGEKLGTLGDAGCFSFFPTKTLGAYGDGGAIVTNDENIYRKSKMIKNHGAETKYLNEVFGYNSRLDSIQASILNLKLRNIDFWINQRISAGKHYDESFSSIKGIELLDNSNSTFNYYSLLIKDGKRDDFKQYLDTKGISSAIYYPRTLPSLPAHGIDESFPVAEKASEEIISIPIWPNIKQKQLEYVTKTIKEYFDYKN